MNANTILQDLVCDDVRNVGEKIVYLLAEEISEYSFLRFLRNFKNLRPQESYKNFVFEYTLYNYLSHVFMQDDGTVDEKIKGMEHRDYVKSLIYTKEKVLGKRPNDFE